MVGREWDDALFSRFDAFQEKLQVCVSRICHFFFSADIPQFPETLERLISPAPTLERLSLTCGGQYFPEYAVIPETLFGGIIPRLSSLELRKYGINWTSPLLRGLRYLYIRSAPVYPSLSVWLDALDEMPQLEILTLQWASPVADDAGSIPFDVERTATLPSLTHIDISESPRDCSFTLAHLDLPALTCLSVKAFHDLPDGSNVWDVFPYIAQHSHGSQDTQTLLIRGKKTHVDIFAWPVPNIDVEVQGSATAPPRVALSLRSNSWYFDDTPNEILGMATRSVPLGGLVTLIIQDFLPPPFEQPWLPNLPKFPLLQHMRLASNVTTGFIDWLKADNGEREDPLLPSLKELVVVDANLHEDWTLRLCEALMKRVEQGVPWRCSTCARATRILVTQQLFGYLVKLWSTFWVPKKHSTQDRK